MLKVLVNASTLVVGGGIQVGVSFIEDVADRAEFEFLFIVSSGIYDSLPEQLKKDSRVVVCTPSPAGILGGRKSRALIKKAEKTFQPDIVYSIGFPSYIFFKTTEVGRYTNPWEINLGYLPWKTVLGIKNKIKTYLGIVYRQLWAMNADFIETQTDAARLGINKRIRFKKERITVIPNSPNPVFINEGRSLQDQTLYRSRLNEIFCLSAGYRHKNLDIIPEVAKILKDNFRLKPRFILTLPDESVLWKEIESTSLKLNVADMVVNVGPLKLQECLTYYKSSKLVFLPTLLEVFSATYLEAMAMKVPIVTTDLDFAIDNCKDGAAFFKYGNAQDAASKIDLLFKDENYYNSIIEKGLTVLNQYPDPKQKFTSLLDWFKQIK